MASRDDLYYRIWSTPVLKQLALSGDVEGLLAAINEKNIPVETGQTITVIDIIAALGVEAADQMAGALKASAELSPSLSLILQGIATNGFNPTNPNQLGLINSLVAGGVLTPQQRDILVSLSTQNRSWAEISLGRAATVEDAQAATTWAATNASRPRVLSYQLMSVQPNTSLQPNLDRVTYRFSLSNGEFAGPYVADRVSSSNAEHEIWVAEQAVAYDNMVTFL